MVVEVDGVLGLERIAHQRRERRGLRGLADHHDLAHVRPLDRGAGGVEERGDRDEERRARVVQLVTDLGGGVGRVDRGDRASTPGDPVEHHRVVRDVGRHQRHGAARAVAARGETTGKASDGVDQFARSDLAARRAVDHHNLAGAIKKPLEQAFGHADVAQRHRRMRAVVDHGSPPRRTLLRGASGKA